MISARLELLIFSSLLFILSSSSYLWRDIEGAKWHEAVMLWVLLPGWGLWNIYNFYKYESMGVGLWIAKPEQEISQRLLACLCLFMIIIPLLAPAK